jgi:hypothetical protein
MTRRSLLKVRPVPETFEGAIQWLRDAEAIPVWSPKTTEGNVYFRRSKSLENRAEGFVEGKHICGEETRKKIVRILGINVEEDCQAIRELIKKSSG